MKANTVKNCVDDLKKLQGLPPYNTPSNLFFADGIFAKSIERNYSRRVRALANKQITDNGLSSPACGQPERRQRR